MADKHYLVEFASRYANSSFKTLKASAALWRAEGLLDDIRELQELKKEAEAKEIPFGHWDRYEIFSYYAVGLCTCLEWHARSRLVDLILFKPGDLQASEAKIIGGPILAQMAAEGLTAAHVLGAATHVSSAREYVASIQRVYDGISIPRDLERELRANASASDLYVTEEPKSLFTSLDWVFSYRNTLVHEIDLGVIGHRSLRNWLSLDEALAAGTEVVKTIQLVEGFITQAGPTDFPNRLDDNFDEEDEYAKVLKRVNELEQELTEALKTEDGEHSWANALSKTLTARTAELEFLSDAEFLQPVRHLDMRRNFQIELLKNRLTFLALLKKEI